MLTYVESEGCQDGRDGRERGVDKHAPLVLSIHIHDFFFMGGCRKNVILLSLLLGWMRPLSGCWRRPARSEYPNGRKLLAIRFLAGQDSQHRGTEDEHLGDEDEYRS